MGKRVVDDASLRAVADKIREHIGFNVQLQFPNGFETGVNEVYNTGFASGRGKGYDEGKADGITAGAEICAAKHFTCSFKGNGETSVSFYVPFEPDALFIIGFDPLGYKGLDSANVVLADLRAFGTAAGLCVYGTQTGVTQSLYTTTSVYKRYSQTADGVVTIKDLVSSRSAIFDSRFTYTAIAVKYAEQTDKERISAFVNGLTGSGTVTLNQAKVEAAFTDDEWAALIATKPDWTFTWV